MSRADMFPLHVWATSRLSVGVATITGAEGMIAEIAEQHRLDGRSSSRFGRSMT